MKFLTKTSFLIIIQTLLWFTASWAAPLNETESVSLNGEWQMGFSRNYNRTVHVPGIANDPAVIVDEVLWYKKEIKLPEGNWEKATLQLKGARFLPQVYVNGDLVGEQNGGMVSLFFPLNHKAIQPGNLVKMVNMGLGTTKLQLSMY